MNFEKNSPQSNLEPESEPVSKILNYKAWNPNLYYILSSKEPNMGPYKNKLSNKSGMLFKIKGVRYTPRGLHKFSRLVVAWRKKI